MGDKVLQEYKLMTFIPMLVTEASKKVLELRPLETNASCEEAAHALDLFQPWCPAEALDKAPGESPVYGGMFFPLYPLPKEALEWFSYKWFIQALRTSKLKLT